MTNPHEHDPIFVQLWTEIASVKMILHAAIKGILPADQVEAWQEIEAMVTHIDRLSKLGKIEGADTQANAEINKRAADSAAAFLRTIGPAMERN